jgi:starch-binding outer membrane protein, SusD/RagB family
MMKKYWFIPVMLLFPMLGCTDVLQKENPDAVGDYIWDNYDYATLYLDNLYYVNLPAASWGGNINSSDEALSSGASNYLWGTATISEAETYSKDFWAQIRRINIMITELNEGSTLEADSKDLLMGQVRFLRAIKYYELVRFYGGVPIVEKPLDYELDDLDLPRSTTAECINFIVSDLDYAIDHLPANWQTLTNTNDDYGRLTKLAAMAYKGRVLMTFASPMFSERDSYTAQNGNTINESSISTESSNARWVAAYNTNKQAYDSLLAYGYGLLDDYNSIFTTEAAVNKEAVMVRLYTGNNYTHSWENSIRPYSMGGNGRNINPSWPLVKAYPMANGKRTFETGSGFTNKYFWKDRDPRFYATIVYNGCIWDMAGTSGRRQWSYEGTVEEGGLIPQTSMYCKKAQDVSLSRGSLSLGKIDWIEIRMAEVMLNVAECANEMNRIDGSHAEEAAGLLRQIRMRAGITSNGGVYGIASGLDYTETLDLTMNERFVELAFENQRYWDLRRRMMFTRDLSANTLMLNSTVRKRVIIFLADEDSAAVAAFEAKKATLDLTDANYYQYFSAPEFYSNLNMNNPPSYGINYRPDYYFMPIPPDRMKNTTKMLQTIGWSAGDDSNPLEKFDPISE